MRLLKFSKKLLQLLKDKGVRYCYSRTIIRNGAAGDIQIILTPCLKKPDIRRLPAKFDTFYSIRRELNQMARCVDEDIRVYIDMNELKLKGAM